MARKTDTDKIAEIMIHVGLGPGGMVCESLAKLLKRERATAKRKAKREVIKKLTREKQTNEYNRVREAVSFLDIGGWHPHCPSISIENVQKLLEEERALVRLAIKKEFQLTSKTKEPRNARVLEI